MTQSLVAGLALILLGIVLCFFDVKTGLWIFCFLIGILFITNHEPPSEPNRLNKTALR